MFTHTGDFTAQQLHSLIDICNRIFTASDERYIADAIVIDKSAAFDCIAHEILLRKLKKYKMHPATMDDRLDSMMSKLKTYLNNSKMTILWEFMLFKQKLCKARRTPHSLITLNEQGDIKEVQESSTCLWVVLQGDLQWKAQMETGEDAILPILRKKLGALKYVGKNIPRAGKLLLANGIILGKLNYLLTLYRGPQEKYLRKLQVICNNTIRFVTGAGERTLTLELVNSVNWLTVKEMIRFQTLVMGWKLFRMGAPRKLAEKFTVNEDWTVVTKTPH